MDQPQTAAAISETDFAAAGFTILAQGAKGPLLLEKHERDGLRLHALFHPDRSTLPYRVGFPILVSNLVQAAQRESKLAEATGTPTGMLPPIALEPNRAYRIDGPQNSHREARTDSDGQLAGLAIPRAGEYVISGAGAPVARLGASLLSPIESALTGIDQIEFSDRLTVQSASAAPIKSDRTLWWPLACAAFVLLLIEWWYFQRRPPARAA